MINLIQGLTLRTYLNREGFFVATPYYFITIHPLHLGKQALVVKSPVALEDIHSTNSVCWSQLVAASELSHSRYVSVVHHHLH